MFLRWKAPIFPICQHGTEVSTKWNRNYPLATRAHFYTGASPVSCALRGRQPGRLKSGLFCVTSFRTRGCTPCAAMRLSLRTLWAEQFADANSTARKVLNMYPQTVCRFFGRRSFLYPSIIFKEVIYHAQTENRPGAGS